MLFYNVHDFTRHGALTVNLIFPFKEIRCAIAHVQYNMPGADASTGQSNP